MSWTKYEMAEQVIKFFTPGCSVNLGIGMPTVIAELIPSDFPLVIHSENGVMVLVEDLRKRLKALLALMRAKRLLQLPRELLILIVH